MIVLRLTKQEAAALLRVLKGISTSPVLARVHDKLEGQVKV